MARTSDVAGGDGLTREFAECRDWRLIPLLLVFVTVLWGMVARGGFYRSDLIVLVALSVICGVVVVVVEGRMAPPSWRWSVCVLSPVAAVCVAAVADHDLGDAWFGLAPLVSAAALGCCGAALARLGGRVAVLAVVSGIGTLLAVSCWCGVAFHVAEFAQPLNEGWRAVATLGYANVTALVLLLAAVTAGALAARSGRFGDEVQCWLCLVGVLCTQSRAAVIALLVCVGLGLAGRRRVAVVLARAGGAALVAFAGLVPSVVASPNVAIAVVAVAISYGLLWWSAAGRPTRTTGTTVLGCLAVAAGASCVVALRGRAVDVGSDEGRLGLWREALTMVRRAGWFGIGPSQLADLSRGVTSVVLVHNDFLQYALYYGLPGLVALGVVCWRIGSALRVAHETAPPELWDLACAVLTAVSLCAAVDFPLQVPIVPAVTALIVAACLVPAGELDGSASDGVRRFGWTKKKEGMLCVGTQR